MCSKPDIFSHQEGTLTEKQFWEFLSENSFKIQSLLAGTLALFPWIPLYLVLQQPSPVAANIVLVVSTVSTITSTWYMCMKS